MTDYTLLWNQEDTPEELHSILRSLADEYPISTSEGNYKLNFEKISANHLTVEITGKNIKISYHTTADATRGIGSALAGLDSSEHTEFKTFGIMLDCSRNAVMKVAPFKKWLRHLALMGYNMAMLYTEDTYQLPNEPFFGYKRGPYTMAEIKEIDAYAKTLGIEMIACIQTLGHMEQILQWGNAYADITDTRRVMLVDEEKTYQLIEKMLTFWSEALTSNRIHIGMDETHDLGRGHFMDKFGYERGFDIFNRHFARVEKMCKEHHLRPMIWSDMYFRMSNPQQEYYDLKSKIPQDVIAKIPKDSDLVYWDYYHKDEQFYCDFIQRHRDLGHEPLMGSGLWTWGKLWGDHDQNEKTARPCIQACHKQKIKEFFFTLWGDNGAFCEINSIMADLCWGSELAYGNTDDAQRLEAKFKAITGGSYKNHMIAAKLNAHILTNKENNTETIDSVGTLWDDPLLGLCFERKKTIDSNFAEKAIHLYESICEELADQRNDNAAGDINHAWLYADFLRQKVAFRRDLLQAYKAKDKATLNILAEETLPVMMIALTAVSDSIRKMWLRYYKPFGLEVLQTRQGGQLLRLQEAQTRLREYDKGIINSIPELES
ncbi:MAG: family 20 glycosylhydrolase [Lentisphaeria bacterium]